MRGRRGWLPIAVHPPGGIAGGFRAGGITLSASTLYTPTKDRTMQNRGILAVVAALALGLGGCGETPLLSPGGPNYDSGPTIGTGHRADTTSVGSTTPSSTPTDPTILDDGSAERGGPTIGTGH